MLNRDTINQSITHGFKCATALIIAAFVFSFIWLSWAFSNWQLISDGSNETNQNDITWYVVAMVSVLALGSAIPARILGAPWWSGLLTGPLAAAIAFPIVRIVRTVPEELGLWSAGEFILVLGLLWMTGFLLLSMRWSGTYEPPQYRNVLIVGAVLAVLFSPIDLSPAILIWWYAAWIALGIASQVRWSSIDQSNLPPPVNLAYGIAPTAARGRRAATPSLLHRDPRWRRARR